MFVDSASFVQLKKKNANSNQNTCALRDPRDFSSLLVSHQLQTTFLPPTYQSFHEAQISGWAVNFGVTLIFIGGPSLLFIKGAKYHTPVSHPLWLEDTEILSHLKVPGRSATLEVRKS